MKLAALALAAVLATPALAQTATHAAAPAADAATPKFTLATPIETIAADPAGKAVLNADIPGLLVHPMYESFKSMGLLDLQGIAEGKLTDAMLAKAKVDLAALK